MDEYICNECTLADDGEQCCVVITDPRRGKPTCPCIHLKPDKVPKWEYNGQH